MIEIDNEILKKTILNIQKELSTNFSDKLDSKIIATLANMLSLHYLSKKEEINIEKISKKLDSRLGNLVFPTYDFSITMSLFADLISDREENNIDKEEEINKAIISELISDLNPFDEDLEEFKNLLPQILQNKDKSKLISYLQSNKKSFFGLFKQIQTARKDSKNNITDLDVTKIIKKLALKENKIKEAKNTISSLLSLGIGGGIAIACTISLGIFAPVALLPATYFAVKLSSNIVTQISSGVVDTVSAITNTGQKRIINSLLQKPAPQISVNAKDKTNGINQEIISQAIEIGFGKIHAPIKEKKEHTEEVKKAAERLKNKIPEINY